MAPRKVPPHERFLTKFQVDEATGCWLWSASLMPNGYAQFRYRTGKNGYGHRFAYEHYVGPIPEGHELDHLCRVRHCVNPQHLEPVAHHTNVHRGEGKAAANARKTHCPKGHEYTPTNTYVNPKGSRVCRKCIRLKREAPEAKAYQREYQRQYEAKRRKRYAEDADYRERRKRAVREHKERKRASKAEPPPDSFLTTRPPSSRA